MARHHKNAQKMGLFHFEREIRPFVSVFGWVDSVTLRAHLRVASFGADYPTSNQFSKKRTLLKICQCCHAWNKNGIEMNLWWSFVVRVNSASNRHGTDTQISTTIQGGYLQLPAKLTIFTKRKKELYWKNTKLSKCHLNYLVDFNEFVIGSDSRCAVRPNLATEQLNRHFGDFRIDFFRIWSDPCSLHEKVSINQSWSKKDARDSMDWRVRPRSFAYICIRILFSSFWKMNFIEKNASYTAAVMNIGLKLIWLIFQGWEIMLFNQFHSSDLHTGFLVVLQVLPLSEKWTLLKHLIIATACQYLSDKLNSTTVSEHLNGISEEIRWRKCLTHFPRFKKMNSVENTQRVGITEIKNRLIGIIVPIKRLELNWNLGDLHKFAYRKPAPISAFQKMNFVEKITIIRILWKLVWFKSMNHPKRRVEISRETRAICINLHTENQRRFRHFKKWTLLKKWQQFEFDG